MSKEIKDTYFSKFKTKINHQIIPEKFNLMIDEPHPLCLLAAGELQDYLSNQTDWIHNFGLSDDDETPIIGKMFGVLVVQNQENELGYLSAFSGKLAGCNQHAKFVPPVFDLLTENGFLNPGMKELTHLNQEIRDLEAQGYNENLTHIRDLKLKRKNHSIALQNKIFNHYHFLNQAGAEKSLSEIFKDIGYKNPPAGAGECAAPKLLQYAFQHKMKPIALAEFWWGQSPKSDFWKHGQFYPCCREKCEPIFKHMLSKIDIQKG
ncbi:hypothetical protein [Pedobacter jamesrossensis]|uniref:tRNA pseudouridine32 synthase / 23S rRNA pseudouridine746 synthase n=1 Tax=Pedobacter jamesrossensis TaxID=1908238 RepID=A0ABV8NNQ5_9SPHI